MTARRWMQPSWPLLASAGLEPPARSPWVSGLRSVVGHHRRVRTPPWSRRILIPVVEVLLLSAGCANEAEPDIALDGKALYTASCGSCHGTDLRGTDQGPSHLSAVYEPGHHPDASFEAAIRQGARQHHWNFGDMPAVEGLDEAEVQAVIAYVRTVQREQGFEPYP